MFAPVFQTSSIYAAYVYTWNKKAAHMVQIIINVPSEIYTGTNMIPYNVIHVKCMRKYTPLAVIIYNYMHVT